MNAIQVFVCDQDQERRRLLHEVARGLGYEPRSVERPELARAAAEGPALLAVAFRSREGFVAWRRLASSTGAPLAALVRAGDDELTRTAWEGGADEVIAWPCSRAELEGRLKLLASAASLRAEVAGFGRVLNSVVRALEARVPYTTGHSQRVGEVAAVMALEIGIPREEAERVRQASWVHNLGEVAISERTLWGESRLTPEEEVHIRRHPQVGWELLQGLPSMAPYLPHVLHHHERLDGSGYPDGLSGDEIPREVQLVSLADAYDALTSPRPYRPARSHSAAMQILLSESRQGLWAPELLDALERAARKLGLSDTVLDAPRRTFSQVHMEVQR